MLNNNAVSKHYTHGSLLNSIQAGIEKLGKTPHNISVDDLGPVDEFHIGGRQATDRFISQLNFTNKRHILDIGCGLGGATRYVANKYNVKVTGIDLTPEYVETGNVLSSWVKLDDKISLIVESALAMSFADATFDGAYMLHVGMNIADKEQLFKEIFRVMKQGSTLGIYDILENGEGELTYPLPWASDSGSNQLATSEWYKAALAKAGFKVSLENNRREFALEFFKKMKEKNEANGGPPPLGLHTLMQKSTPVKLKNMLDGIEEGFIAPVEIIAYK